MSFADPTPPRETVQRVELAAPSFMVVFQFTCYWFASTMLLGLILGGVYYLLGGRPS